jgi:hypothetical protein
MNFVAFAGTACVFLNFGPQGALVIFLIGLPWLTLLLVKYFRPDLSINGSRASDMTIGLLMPSLGLALRALADCTPLNWLGPTIMTVVGTAMLTLGAAYVIDGRKKWVTLLLLALLCTSYGYGAGMEIDSRWNTTVREVHAVKVLSKRISNGKGHTPYFTVGSWGSRLQPTEITAPSGMYWRVNVGDVVCINEYAGTLNVGWYRLTSCDSTVVSSMPR